MGAVEMSRSERRKLALRREYPRVVAVEALGGGTIVSVAVAMKPGVVRTIRVSVRDMFFWMDERGER